MKYPMCPTMGRINHGVALSRRLHAHNSNCEVFRRFLPHSGRTTRHVIHKSFKATFSVDHLDVLSMLPLCLQSVTSMNFRSQETGGRAAAGIRRLLPSWITLQMAHICVGLRDNGHTKNIHNR